MNNAAINLLLAFIEGFALIISPCILPILPLILSGSLMGSQYRPFGIIVGFIVVFTFFTLFSNLLVTAAHLDPSLLRNIALGILLVFGLIMFSSYLNDKFNKLFSKINYFFPAKNINYLKGGFWNGVIFGGLLGIIWTPCVGPILAVIIVQTIIQKTSFLSLLVTASFALGVSIPMLLIALIGRKMSKKLQFFRHHAIVIRKILGLIIIAGALILYYQNWFSSLASKIKPMSANIYSKSLINSYPAPPIEGISAWINSPPLQLKDLKGKVVLIDFWTYSCINCIRTLPYLNKWYSKYHKQGLVIIGVHSPEFAFERELSNVQKAVKTFGIDYPVALDNNFITWQNYNNLYWPAHYLIDKNGNVVYQQFGEGNEEITENKIRQLLGINKIYSASEQIENPREKETPETYLGFERAGNFLSPDTPKIKRPFIYHYPSNLPINNWALQGNWIVDLDKIISAESKSALKIHFRAKKVYAVMGTQGPSQIVNIYLDGKLVNKGQGRDVKNSKLIVRDNRLYEILNLEKFSEGFLELKTTNAGLELYTFTFGND